ncbi:MAG: GDP-mannose 4,6-dehydratase [Proteobacteria bacterium]|nr:GDP-mannose 4,6-dehydratase [Pseudomonadota bacterium]
MPRLEAEGAEVIARDRELDVTDASGVADTVAAEHPEAIVHLAAQSSPSRSHGDPLRDYRVNYLGTRAVLEAAWRHARSARVLVVGSADQYGPRPVGSAPLDESDGFRPTSPYGRTKAAAELLATDYAARGLDVVRVRAFNHIGPGQSEIFVASSFAKQLAEIARGARRSELLVGNLDAVRDFTDVRDVVDAYVRLLDRSVPARVFNVASGVGVRVRVLLDHLCEAAGHRPAVRVDNRRLRRSDQLLGRSDALRRATGWSPRIELGQTLRDLYAAWERVEAAG